jgi:hypothetical protein
VIVNETFVRRFLKDTPPIGARVRRMAMPGLDEPPPMAIVGVVRDAAYRSVRDEAAPTAYLPMAQMKPAEMPPFASLRVRAANGRPALLIKGVAAALSDTDPVSRSPS